MADTVIVLDAALELSCPARHRLLSFHTKDFDRPSMATYLLHYGRLFLAEKDEHLGNDDESVAWRIRGERAIREHRYSLREVQAPLTVRVYGTCDVCDPVLIRSERATFLGDVIQEHALFVDFQLTFRTGEPVQVERLSGSRADFEADLRRRGFYVLEDDEPLAMAHRELNRARARFPPERWARM